MQIFKLSFFIKNPMLLWDYNKAKNTDIWSDINSKLITEISLKDYFLCKKGSYQHIYYFMSNDSADEISMSASSIVENIIEFNSSFCIKDIIISVLPSDTQELSSIKGSSESYGNTEKMLHSPDISAPASHTDEPAEDFKNISDFKIEQESQNETDSDDEKTAESVDLNKIILKYKAFKEFLLENVKGQRHAVDEVVEGLFETEVFSIHNQKRKGPLATFLFAGPSGVGKTHIAHLCEEYLGKKTLIVDMSEFSSNLANGMFNGEFGNEALVTSFVRKNPDGILVFDEIEKAHINTIHLFLQILDEAKLMDHKIKKEVSFKNNIIIMTTNAGKQLYSDTTVCDLSGKPRNVILDGLRKDINPQTGEPFFPDCITTRMANGRVILFNHLEPFSLHSIVAKEITVQLDLFKKSTSIDVECNLDELAALVMYSAGGVSDARTLRGLAKEMIVKELQEIIMQIYNNSPNSVKSVKTIKLCVDTSCENTGNLFKSNEKSYAVVLSEADADYIKQCFNKYNTEAEVITDADKFKKRIRGVVDYVVIDPHFNVSEMKSIPNDIEDINSVGMQMFEYIVSDFSELPVFILNTHPEENIRYDTLLSRGAKRVIVFNKADQKSFENEIEKLSFESCMNNSVYLLSRSGKVLTYNCAQYIVDESTAIVSFEKLYLKSALMGEDGAMVAQKGENNNLLFKDVIGCKTAKETLLDFKNALENMRTFAASGKRMPKGVLLYGPPGTGKTMLAKAMANECNATFFPASATSFFGSLVGETEKNIRTLFEKARKYAPSIIFVDEIDAIARKRTGDSTTVHYESALNEFLTQMDGFKTDEKRPVFVFVATNYELEGDSSRVLDPAFVRRFDSKLFIPLPDTDERYEFLVKSLEKHGIHFGEDHEAVLRNMAERTAGMSNADLEMLNAQYIRELGDNEPDRNTYMNALDAYRYGEVKDVDDDTMRQTAIHEAGHALVNRLCGETPSFLTIVSRGDFGGYMQHETSKRGSYTFEYMKDRICCSLAGRVAEVEIYGESLGINTGARSDIRHARYWAKNIFEDYAMGNKLYEHIADTEAEALLQELYQKTKTMIHDKHDVLVKLAQELVKSKSLDKVQLEAFFANEGI